MCCALLHNPSMSFLAVLFALLLEQLRPLLPNNAAHSASRAWVRWVSRSFDAGKNAHGWLTWTSAVCAPALGCWAIYFGLGFVHAGAALAWVVLVLYWTLGFRQFSHHFTAVRDAIEADDMPLARQHFARWKQVDASDIPQTELIRHVIEHSVLSSHRHVFGVLAWFLVGTAVGAGPAGAVLYRLCEFAHRYWHATLPSVVAGPSAPLKQISAMLWHATDFVPARLTALSLAVMGSFEDAIDCWRNYTQRLSDAGRTENDAVILAATSGAMGVRLGGDALGNAVFDANASATFVVTPSQSMSEDSTIPGLRKRVGAAIAARTRGASTAPPADSLENLTPGAQAQAQHLRSVVGLIWRIVVLWLFMLVLLTLANLLG